MPLEKAVCISWTPVCTMVTTVFHRGVLTVQEAVMALSKAEQCQELARLVGIPLMEGEVVEVAERFESLMRELSG